MNIQLLNFGESQFKVVVENGKPFFCAQDVTKILGYANGRDAIQRHCQKDGVVKHDSTDSLGRPIQISYINEGNLYRLIFGSNLPEAVKFESIVCDEVLPSIRKTGMYMTDLAISNAISDPDSWIMMLTELKKERQQRNALEAENKALKPKADFADRVIDTDNKVDIGQAAKLLKLPFGRNIFFKQLKEKGIFFKNRNEPKQEYIQRGYFELRQHIVPTEHHGDLSVTKVLVNQPGLYWLSKQFGASFKEGLPTLNIL